ncbi:MAG: caspase family protein [Vulcanimicrobiota bacterium]
MARKALVIGIGKYPPPQRQLKAVARDVKAIGELLESDRAGFTNGVRFLTDTDATLQVVRAELIRLLAKARKSDEILLFMAGHGKRAGRDAYFCPVDVQFRNLPKTALPLAEVMTLFNQCKSEKMVFFLDFCYSGAILARATSTPPVPRELSLVRGKGRVILCACSDTEVANESRNGHGWFTKSVLDGLKGKAKNAQGDVTPMSLFDHSVHQVESLASAWGEKQTPRFFGDIEGKFSIVHIAKANRMTRAPAKAPMPEKLRKTPLPQSTVPKTSDCKWHTASKSIAYLDGVLVKTVSVNEPDREKIELTLAASSAQVSAKLRTLRDQRYTQIRFAHGGIGGFVHLESAVPHTQKGLEQWVIRLTRRPANNIEYDFQGYSADKMAEMKARRVLLDQEVDTGLVPYLQLARSSEPCPLSKLKFPKPTANELKVLLLECVFLLCSQGIVEHVLDLAFQPTEKGVKVRFKGQRKRCQIGFSGTYRKK